VRGHGGGGGYFRLEARVGIEPSPGVEKL